MGAGGGVVWVTAKLTGYVDESGTVATGGGVAEARAD